MLCHVMCHVCVMVMQCFLCVSLAQNLCIQNPWNSGPSIQTMKFYQNLSNLIKTYQILSKLIKLLSSGTYHFFIKSYQNISNSLEQHFLFLSNLIKISQILLNDTSHFLSEYIKKYNLFKMSWLFFFSKCLTTFKQSSLDFEHWVFVIVRQFKHCARIGAGAWHWPSPYFDRLFSRLASSRWSHQMGGLRQAQSLQDAKQLFGNVGGGKLWQGRWPH